MTDSKTRIAGLLLFLGDVQFLFSLMLAEFLYPDYSISQNYISDLGATCRAVCTVYQPSSLIFNSSLIIAGILVALSAYTFLLEKIPRSRLLIAFLFISAISSAGVGLFPESAGVIHSIFALIAFFSLGLASISASRLTKVPLNAISLILGLLTIIFIFLFTGKIYLGLGPGGAERLVLYPVLFWGLAFSGWMMKE